MIKTDLYGYWWVVVSKRQKNVYLWNDEAKTTAAKISFSRDMAKLWNNAPTTITNAPCLNSIVFIWTQLDEGKVEQRTMA